MESLNKSRRRGGRLTPADHFEKHVKNTGKNPVDGISIDKKPFTIGTRGELSDLVFRPTFAKHIISKMEEKLHITKSLLDEIPESKYFALRNNHNPYEKISFFFQNRAAFKLVELDEKFKLIPSLENATDYFEVADICSGPGGFSEYILTKLKWAARVHGFTLRSTDNFRVDDFNRSAVTECFHPYYGADGDGNITSLRNLESLSEKINTKVDLVTADGGFSIHDENKQELFSRKMMLGEFLVPLMILKTGGDFVCKLFTTFTEFSFNLIFLTVCLFENVHIIKPISSRVANSEVFLVCKKFKGIEPDLLEDLKGMLNISSDTPKDSTQECAVYDSFLETNSVYEAFKSELTKINEKLCSDQIAQLGKIISASRLIRNHALEATNEEIQRIIAEKVSAKYRIHRDYRTKSPPNYLYYDPLYGCRYASVDAIKADGVVLDKNKFYLIKTGEIAKLINKQVRVPAPYVTRGFVVQHTPIDIDETLIEKMPYDTILECRIANGSVIPTKIVHSFLPGVKLDPNLILYTANLFDNMEHKTFGKNIE